MRTRAGIVLPMVVAILLLLVVMAGAIHLLRRQTYKGLDRLDGFLRAVSVGEAAHARSIARLESAPWTQRWFTASSDTGSGTWGEGSYTYLIADGPGQGEADLIVSARADESQVVMFWRLHAQMDTLSPFRRVRSTYFSYLDPETSADSSALAGLRAQVASDLAARLANASWEMETEDAIGASPMPDRIATTLSLTMATPPPDEIPSVTPGGTGVPIGPALQGGPEPVLPPFPVPPPLAQPTLPARGATIEALAQGRQSLRDGRLRAEEARKMLQTSLGCMGSGSCGGPATGKLDNIKSQCAPVQQKCNDTSPSAPPPPPPDQCDKCAKCMTAVNTVIAQLQAQVQQTYTAIQDCMNSIDTSAQSVDNAASQRPVVSDSAAASLAQQSQDTSDCGSAVKNTATQQINAAKAAVSNAGCNESIAP